MAALRNVPRVSALRASSPVSTPSGLSNPSGKLSEPAVPQPGIGQLYEGAGQSIQSGEGAPGQRPAAAAVRPLQVAQQSAGRGRAFQRDGHRGDELGLTGEAGQRTGRQAQAAGPLLETLFGAPRRPDAAGRILDDAADLGVRAFGEDLQRSGRQRGGFRRRWLGADGVRQIGQAHERDIGQPEQMRHAVPAGRVGG